MTNSRDMCVNALVIATEPFVKPVVRLLGNNKLVSEHVQHSGARIQYSSWRIIGTS